MSKATPQTIIEMVCKDANGDRQKAAGELAAKARSNVDLRDYLVRLGATAAVGNHMCKERAEIVHGGVVEPFRRPLKMAAPSVSSLQAAERRARRRPGLEVKILLDMTLFGSAIRLGDATKAQVLESAAAYDSVSRPNAIQATFQYMVAERLNGTQITREVLSNEALTDLFTKAERSHTRHLAVAAE